jgi:hypothetical protein
VLSGFVAAACASSAADKYPTYDNMCDAKATQECQVAARCAVDSNVCKGKRKQACLDAANTALQAGRKYTSGLAEGCVNTTKDIYALPTIAPKDKFKMDDTCARVFAGTAAKGVGCTSSYDCTGAMICDRGHCGDRVEKKKGEGCGNPGEVCEAGAFCQNQSGVSICVAREDSGKPCNPTDLCLENLRCDVVCRDRVGVGAPCQTDDDCASSAPYCDPDSNHICTAGISFAPGSGDCRPYGST